MEWMMWELPNDRILNIAHRGARSLAPENTLAAARKALDTGADMWELDVCMTRDGELVVVHDTTLDRTSNAREVFPHRRPWNVHDFSLEELRFLDFGSWFNRKDPFGRIASGEVKEAETLSYVGEPAPLLREALTFTLERKWFVNVEIKDLSGTRGHGSVPEKVIALIEELGAADRVHVSSFNLSYLRRAKARNSEVSLGVLRSRSHHDPSSLLARLGARMFHPRLGAVRMRDISRLRDQGVPVLVWVANDERTMLELISARVSGIFTDFPQTLKLVLDREMRSRSEIQMGCCPGV
jgi:glycerophosphoryl diester phosphodiesterase